MKNQEMPESAELPQDRKVVGMKFDAVTNTVVIAFGFEDEDESDYGGSLLVQIRDAHSLQLVSDELIFKPEDLKGSLRNEFYFLKNKREDQVTYRDLL